MYAVMGITGQVGGATARALLGAGHAVRGIVRNPAKAANWADQGVALAVADQSDAASLRAALVGVEGAFVMLPPMFTPSPDFAEARALSEALRSAIAGAGVPRVVALSTIGAEHETGTGILKGLYYLEQALRTLPMPVTFLRAAWFMENAAWDIQPAFDTGRLHSHLQPLDRPIPMVSTEDIGWAIADVLTHPWAGHRVVELEGPHRYAPLDLAASLSNLVRRPVRSSAVPREAWVDQFQSHGASPEAAELRAEMLDGFNSGHVEFTAGSGNEHRRGRTTLDDAIGRLISQ